MEDDYQVLIFKEEIDFDQLMFECKIVISNVELFVEQFFKQFLVLDGVGLVFENLFFYCIV